MSDNVANDGNLAANQRQALDALATGATKEQAATIANVTRRTLDRWIAEDSAFKQALDDVNAAAVEDAIQTLSGLLQRANRALQDILDNATAKDRDKLRAAEMVYSIYIRMRQHGALEDRVTALEERLGNG